MIPARRDALLKARYRPCTDPACPARVWERCGSQGHSHLVDDHPSDTDRSGQ